MKSYLIKFSIIAILTVSFATACTAEGQGPETETKEQVETEKPMCDKELAEQGVTSAMLDCLYQEIEEKDNELNQIYKKMQSMLSDEAKEKLKQSQLIWIKFKDKEQELIYSMFGGSMAKITAGSVYLRTIERRIEDLNNYVTTLEVY